ncbi:hypothetical protein T4B_3906 [Trichinella pseudospiralis]|uniref:Transmembrane protein n=1 Tax=Trichinella pseudospiralis TaxID=6337 RepID=A0A0V1IUX8_TRIPS|nr:hypothetical protein T4B_3906 [Trichinella pseudospiralis]
MIASLAKRKREAKVVIILETEKHFDTTGSGDIILPSLKIKLPSSQPHQFKAHNQRNDCNNMNHGWKSLLLILVMLISLIVQNVNEKPRYCSFFNSLPIND